MTALVAEAAPALDESAATRSLAYRRDLQGLRALSVAAVVTYHLAPAVLPGGFVGVDVFFVISGYLITGHLVASAERTGRLRLIDFWGRRARRLLPAAALVLTVTWCAAQLLLPATRLAATAEQIRASALYFQNVVLSRNAVDYLTSADTPSPVQHFWSLSVEEQFYLLWPVLLLAVGAIAVRLTRGTARTLALGAACAVTAVSFAYCIELTRTDQPAAYFQTTTRIWELAAGGVCALIPVTMARAIGRHGWLATTGLAVITASCLLVGSSAVSAITVFPGAIAAVPVGGAMLAVLAGAGRGRFGPARLMSVRPMVFLGDISYSLYLWHWPLIVFWQARYGTHLGLSDCIVLVAASVALAWGTTVLVEGRVRTATFFAGRPGRSLAVATVVLVPVLAVASYAAPGGFRAHLDPRHPGAAVLAGDVPAVVPEPVTPPVVDAPDDFAPFERCQTPMTESVPRPCFAGDTTHPRLRVALVGDSVAGQWRTDLDAIARRRHWLMISDLHAECPWSATMTAWLGTAVPYSPCQTWGSRTLHDLLTRLHPDVVITSARPILGTPTHPTPDRLSFAQIADGMVAYWKALQARGIQVVAIRETPEPRRNIPDCLSAPGGSVARCTISRTTAIDPATPLVQATEAFGPAAALVDLNSLICTATTCPPVVGNVVVYRDIHHLTLTYSRTLEPYLERRLLATRALHGR